MTADHRRLAIEALEESRVIFESADWIEKNAKVWSLEKSTDDGDKVWSCKMDGNKAFAIVATLDHSIDSLFDLMWHGVETFPEWNHNITQYRVLETLDPSTEILYSLTANIMGGLVKSREFVDARTHERSPEHFLVGYQSIDYTPVPPTKTAIRAHNYVSGMKAQSITATQTELMFLANIDLKGFLFKSVIDKVLGFMMTEDIKLIRKQLIKLNTQKT